MTPGKMGPFLYPSIVDPFGGMCACTVAPELLAPAGAPSSFNAALAAGADAIYCALGNDFNARRSADNFTPETFAAACREAHLAGARVYVTENVVIRTDEMPAALALVRRAWLLGADAFIIQDWGLLAEVRRLWPQIECHVSTQANVHDARGVAWCRDLGVDRVTLSRELSVEEIARIAQEGVELEGFGHGALCFCYSGICLMSAHGGRPLGQPRHVRSALPAALPADGRDGRQHRRRRHATAVPQRLLHHRRPGRAGRGRPRLAQGGGPPEGPDYVHAVVRAYRERARRARGGEERLAHRSVPSACCAAPSTATSPTPTSTAAPATR